MSPLAQFSGQWAAISPLLDEALSLPPSAHAAWLAGLSGEHATQREALHALLAHHAAVETGSFLGELPRLEVDPTRFSFDGLSSDGLTSDGLAPNAQVGPYRLIAEIGRGGMGTVWLAERADGLMQRRVALKLPRLVWGGDFAERLHRERHILATLEHQHIARLYDAGLDAQQRPYLAMEFVEGEAIDVHCRSRSSSVRQRLELLLQVAAAVSHAHSKLIVHRDLKPANILVTADAQVKLLDFGIAKLLDGERTRETALTALSGRALTLDYASPEQIRGEPLGTASDIYSLAVVAYELLSGGMPYRLKRGSAAELEAAIAAAQAPRASDTATEAQRQRQLRGDLDAILNKALKKRLEERYPTMDAFAEDLRRWRDGEPVQARPDTAGYRAAKFIGRHRLQVAAGVAVSLALVAGTTVALWQAREARLQAAQARTEAATAEAVRGFLDSIFQSNNRDQDDPDAASRITARELLDRGAARIEVELRDAPQARCQLLGTLADMFEGMALLDKAADLGRRRVLLARQTLGPLSFQYAQALAGLAQTAALLDRRQESMAATGEAAAILDRLGDHRSATRFRIDYASALNLERSDGALGLAAAGRAVANARLRSAPADLVRALLIQGEIAQGAADHRPLARDSAREAIRLIEADPRLGANSLSDQYLVLADALSGLGELGEAEQRYHQSLDIARQRNRAAPIYEHTAAWRYGSFLRSNSRLRESVEVLRPGYFWAKAHPAGAGVMPPSIVAEYGRALVAYGRVAEGLAVFDEAMALPTGAEATPDLVGPIWLFKAQGLLQLRRWDDAHAALLRARALFEAAAVPIAGQLDAAWRQWQVGQGHAAEALQAFDAGRAARRKSTGSLQDESPRLIAESAWLHLQAGQPERAAEQARQAVLRIEADRWRTQLADAEARATAVWGEALLQLGDADAARALLTRSLRLHEALYDPKESPALAKVTRLLADAKQQATSTVASGR